MNKYNTSLDKVQSTAKQLEIQKANATKILQTNKNLILYHKKWCSTLKTVLSPNSSNSLPSLDKDRHIITDDLDKANALNDYFRD